MEDRSIRARKVGAEEKALAWLKGKVSEELKDRLRRGTPRKPIGSACREDR